MILKNVVTKFDKNSGIVYNLFIKQSLINPKGKQIVNYTRTLHRLAKK